MPTATESGCQEYCVGAAAQLMLLVLVLIAAPEMCSYYVIRVKVHTYFL